MRKLAIGLGISSALLTAGCSDSEETADIGVSESETVAEDEAAEQEVEQLESPYQEIKEHFDSYELPEEGRVPDSEFVNAVEYENGYAFDQDTNALMARVHTQRPDLQNRQKDKKRVSLWAGFKMLPEYLLLKTERAATLMAKSPLRYLDFSRSKN